MENGVKAGVLQVAGPAVHGAESVTPRLSSVSVPGSVASGP